MDTPVKTLVNMFFIFSGVFLLLSCLSLYLMSNNAKNVMYSVVEYIEINDENHVDLDTINNYCDSHGVACTILPVSGDDVEIDGDKNRYEVQVSFSHIFAWVNLRKNITISSMTRSVDY